MCLSVSRRKGFSLDGEDGTHEDQASSAMLYIYIYLYTHVIMYAVLYVFSPCRGSLFSSASFLVLVHVFGLCLAPCRGSLSSASACICIVSLF